MLPSTLLQHYRSINAAFLHALGEAGTEQLLRQLNLNGSERVLEIGFGTGATLVKLKSRYPGLRLRGIEADPGMLKKCSSRLAFCRLKNKIELLLASDKNNVPAGSIDIIYLESVLGILDQNSLENTFRYIQNVLQPGGILALNESIWLESTSLEEIIAINEHCAAAFGIIQCTPDFHGIEKTIETIEKTGFETVFSQWMSRSGIAPVSRKNYREYLSRLYSILGKFWLLLDKNTRQSDRNFKTEMQNIFKADKAYLSGALLVFKKSMDDSPPA